MGEVIDIDVDAYLHPARPSLFGFCPARMFPGHDSKKVGHQGSQWTLHPLGFTVYLTPNACKIRAFMAIIKGLGLLCYILWGFR